jgi:hypothetical protein
MVFPHNLIKGVSVETSHEQEHHAGTLPPGVATLAVFGEKKSGWETKGHGLSGARSFKPNHFS